MTKIEFIESCLERKLSPLEIELINKYELAATKVKENMCVLTARKGRSNLDTAILLYTNALYNEYLKNQLNNQNLE
nr:MAG TPA: hypothetical protein [Caudoviricetes sp.]